MNPSSTSARSAFQQSRSPFRRTGLQRLSVYAPIPLRVIVGYGFMAHGLAKAARGFDAFPHVLEQIGIPAPHLLGWATILVEIFGGLAVLLGAFVTTVSVPMIVVLLVATFTVHLPYGFSSIKLIAVTAAGAQFGPPGYETDLLYLACIGALIAQGPGPWSLDALLKKRQVAGNDRQSVNQD